MHREKLDAFEHMTNKMSEPVLLYSFFYVETRHEFTVCIATLLWGSTVTEVTAVATMKNS